MQPAGGIEELQTMVNKEMTEWASKISSSTPLSARMINRYIAFIFSAIYVFTVAGRIGAIASLSLREIQMCVDPTTGTILSDRFKTASTFGFQAIQFPSWLKPYFKLWLKHLRPRILATLSPADQARLSQLDAPCFIRLTGGPQCGSSLVSAFFRDHGLTLTSDGIRALVETTAEDALNDGLISPAERASVSNLNGHSGRTVRAHYLMRQAGRDVQNTATFMNTVSNNRSPIAQTNRSSSRPKLIHRSSAKRININNVVARSAKLTSVLQRQNSNGESMTAALDQVQDLGVLHLYNGSESHSIPWLGPELQLTGDLIKEVSTTFPSTKVRAHRCLQLLIHKYPEALRYFHRDHVSSSGRFSYGIKRYEELMEFIADSERASNDHEEDEDEDEEEAAIQECYDDDCDDDGSSENETNKNESSCVVDLLTSSDDELF